MTARVLSIVVGLGCAMTGTAQEKQNPSFEALLEQVKKSDAKADFLKLRMAFTQTPLYNPYDNAADKAGKEMELALERKDYKAALKLTEQVMKSTYVDVKAHLVASRAWAELKNSDQAKYHRHVADGLLQSILKSGNGKSPATAYVVISVDEEVVVLGALGVEKTGQALMPDKDQRIDRIDGIDGKTMRQVTLHFNVTTPFNWLVQRQKGKKHIPSPHALNWPERIVGGRAANWR